MELKDLVGRHKLSGVDYMPSIMEDEFYNCCNDILFCLDGITYLMTEDEDDGWRSYMSEIEVTGRKIKNIFPDQEVVCKYSDDEYNNNILRIYTLKGKLLLEVGTFDYDDWYPCAAFEWHPENMDINLKYNK